MNSRKLMRELKGKVGSYLVEATLTLPVFILAILSLALIIRVIAICETIGYVTSIELKEGAFPTNKIINTVSLCNGIETGVTEECREVTDFRVKQARYLYQSGELYDLISVATETNFTVENPIGIHGEIKFTQRLMARAFTGAVQEAVSLETEAFNQSNSAVNVLIYPRYGQRYHVECCSVVVQQEKRGNEGWEMDVEEAKRQGFTACLLCGGGTK